jgi:citronellol/citronellal dehydrogenase
MAKFGMSMCTLGLAEELKGDAIAANSLWPVTAIATAAVQNLLGGAAAIKGCRKPEIVADAAYWILTQDSKTCSGNFFTDEEVLAKAGVTNLDQYAVSPGEKLVSDIFLD